MAWPKDNIVYPGNLSGGGGVGPQGPEGPAGEDGTNGTNGTNGVDGTDGTNGTNGSPGAAATIAVGAVTAVPNGTPPTVTNSGTSAAAVLDFELETGAKGDQGDPGAVEEAPIDGTPYSRQSAAWVAAGGGSAHVIQDEGTPLTARAALNFVGTGVTATDDSGNSRTVVTISAGGDVSGPATNAADSVPQWNGANSKLLSDGLAVGTAANNLVQLNGSAQLPAVSGALLTGLPASGALVLLEQHTAANSASLDFTTCFTSTYDDYEVHLINLLAPTYIALKMRMSVDGGSTYDATAAHYSWCNYGFIPTGSGAGGNNSDTAIFLNDGVNPGVAGFALSGKIGIVNPLGSLYTSINGLINTPPNPGGYRTKGMIISGTYIGGTGVNAFRILAHTGNITSGTVRVYGIAK